MQEYELYQPIKELLEKEGFAVKGEVKEIDICAMKEDLLIAVELKIAITLKLIYQAIERQKICDKVFIGLPYLATISHKASYKSFILLLKRLDIGLITVKNDTATVVLEPNGYDLIRSRSMNQRKKSRAIFEFSQRENKVNIGGTKGKKITHYKEQVIQIAKTLRELKEASPKMLKEITMIQQTTSILQKNYYLWFKHEKRGVYSLSEIGQTELKDIDQILEKK